MATQLFSSNGRTTLASDLAAAATSATVATGGGALFNSPTGGDFELLTITDYTNYEIIKMTTRSTDTLSVIERAQGGTSARDWTTGAVVMGAITAETLELFPQIGNIPQHVANTHALKGMSLVQKDNGEAATDEHIYYVGQENYIFTKEIDLETLADDVATITIPTGTKFYPNELGVVVTSSDTVTGQPSVSFGITGNTTVLLGSSATTKTAVGDRDIYTPLDKDGVTSLTASVKTGATATTLLGRFYFKGLLLEDE